MSLALPLQIGLRYIRAKRRNQFISFISGFSLLGMTLGVMALIIVLSVMNGFDREIKQRILHVIPHGFLVGKQPLANWQAIADSARQQPQVVAASPYVSGHGLVAWASALQGVEIRGVDPAGIAALDLSEYIVAGSLQALQPGEYGIVLGRLLARYLGVAMGDSVTLTLPQLSVTPAGLFPRVKRFRVVAVFEVGAQVDQNLVLIHVADAQKLYRLGNKVHGVEIKTADMYQAARVVRRAAAPWQKEVTPMDWSQTQGSLFAAVKMEKTVITVLLLIIVAVAAFNIISGLVLMVADKRTDIAVLRTLGLSRQQVMGIFIVQGGAIGLFGVLLGAVLGSLVAVWVGDLVTWLEHLTGLHVFDPNVYFINQLPSQWQWQDVALVASVGLVLSLLSTLYPAYRASLIEPAEALRYE